MGECFHIIVQGADLMKLAVEPDRTLSDSLPSVLASAWSGLSLRLPTGKGDKDLLHAVRLM